jgi:hypothetical protein
LEGCGKGWKVCHYILRRPNTGQTLDPPDAF